jgi:hypothetical protein
MLSKEWLDRNETWKMIKRHALRRHTGGHQAQPARGTKLNSTATSG